MAAAGQPGKHQGSVSHLEGYCVTLKARKYSSGRYAQARKAPAQAAPGQASSKGDNECLQCARHIPKTTTEAIHMMSPLSATGLAHFGLLNIAASNSKRG